MSSKKSSYASMVKRPISISWSLRGRGVFKDSRDPRFGGADRGIGNDWARSAAPSLTVQMCALLESQCLLL